MGNLLVREVPDDLLGRLKERARANGRSAEAEHREILRQALSDDEGAGFEELAAQLRALLAGRRHTPAEELLREMRADPGRQLEAFVDRLVETGRYGSKSEVLREGVRLIQDREAQLAALDAAIDRALAESDAGRGKPADEVFDRLEAKYRAMANRTT